MSGELETIAAKLFFSLLALLKGALAPAIIIFFLALIGKAVRGAIEKEMKWKWLGSTLATTFVICWCLLLLVYFYPIITASQEQGLGLLPSPIAPQLPDVALSYIYGVLKVTLVAAVLCALLLPLELVGSYVHSTVEKRLGKLPSWLKLLASAYIVTLLASFIILFIVPQSVTGLLYLLYYGFPA